MVRLSENLLEQRAFRSRAHRDALARLSIQRTEVLFDLPEIAEQPPRRVLDLEIALLHLRLVERAGPAAAYVLDIALDLRFPALELLDARCGIGLRARRQIAQELEQRQEPRFGSDELLRPQALHPSRRRDAT